MDGKVKYLVIQPTKLCNLNCSYCYLPHRRKKVNIELSTIKKIVQMLKNSHPFLSGSLTVIWHGGEPLIFGKKMFAKALKILQHDSQTPLIKHAIQTNGTLIDDEWVDIFQRYRINVGVSIDGILETNDANRVSWNNRSSFKNTVKGIEKLVERQTPFTTISVVTKKFLDDYKDNLEFLINLGPSRLAFNFEEIEGVNTSTSLDGYSELLVEFYCYLAEISKKYSVKIREIENLKREPFFKDISMINGQLYPFTYMTISAEGFISGFSPELADTKYKGRDFIYGNVNEISGIDELYSNQKLQVDYKSIRNGAKKCYRECKEYKYCGGGEPSNKIFENGTFASSQTINCYIKEKLPRICLS